MAAFFRFNLLLKILVTAIFVAVDIPNTKCSPREEGEGGEDGSIRSLLSSTLGKSILEDGSLDPGSLFQFKMADPLLVPDFNVSSNDGLIDMDGQFRNLELLGLAGITIKQIRLDIGQSKLDFTLQAELLRLEGDYNLEGSITFLSIDGGGRFWLNGERPIATGSVSLRRHSVNGDKLEVDQIELDPRVAEIKVHFEGLLGGGSWGSLSNTLLNQLGDLIFEKVRSSLLVDLKSSIRKDLDSRLAEITDDQLFLANSSAIFDDVLFRAGEHLRETGFDPYPLPNYRDAFRRKLYFLDVYGKVMFENGTLHGLSTLRRTADILFLFENGTITAEARMGFDNLSSSFNWKAQIMDIGPSGETSLTLTKTSAFAKIQIEGLKLSEGPMKFRLIDFRLERIGQIWTEIRGLGSFNFLSEIIINLISNSLKHSLGAAIMGPVKGALQDQLDQLPNQII